MKKNLQKILGKYQSHTKFTNLFITLLFVLVLSTGCNNTNDVQKELDNLSLQYENLQEEYTQLKRDHEDLQAKYESLQSEYDSKQIEIEGYHDQQATINDLNTKLAELQSQYDTLQAERDSLLQQLDAKRLADEQAAQAAQIAQQQSVEQTQSQSGTIVYWTSGGECYHSTYNCSTLKRSKNISSGSIEQSGRRPCKVCH